MSLDPYFLKVKFIHSIGLKIFFMLFFFSVASMVIIVGLELDLISMLPVVFILSFIMALILSGYISSPIRKAMKALNRLADGDTDIDLTTRRKDELGNLIHVLNATTDQLKETKSHAQNIANVKSNFVTVAAHQLRTPATGIKWAVDALSKDEKLPAETRAVVGQMVGAINQIVMIINDLLSTAQLEASRDDYTFAQADIITLINNSITQEQLRAREKNVQIAFHNNSYEDKIELMIDASRMAMVLTNLIDNAVRYNIQNGFVEVTLVKSNEGVEVMVKDTGIGIPQAEFDKIFTQFYRATNAVLSEPNGSGIGLYISKSVIEHHHGTIWFETEEGKGTTFHIKLPLTQPQQ